MLQWNMIIFLINSNKLHAPAFSETLSTGNSFPQVKCTRSRCGGWALAVDEHHTQVWQQLTCCYISIRRLSKQHQHITSWQFLSKSATWSSSFPHISGGVIPRRKFFIHIPNWSTIYKQKGTIGIIFFTTPQIFPKGAPCVTAGQNATSNGKPQLARVSL